MRELFKFLKRFRNLSIFIVLQAIILSIFFNNKNFHQVSFFNTSSAVSGWFIKKRFNIVKHFSLEEINSRLAESNAELLAKLPYSFYPLQQKLYKINDTLNEQQYEYFPARVINYSNHKRNNYATINKGRLSGVKKDMGVISAKGIVGFIVDVSDHYSIIRTILTEQINLTVETNNVIGSLEWRGFDSNLGHIKGITKSAEIEVSDIVITKGSKGLFPYGIPVGVVTGIEDRGGFATLDVEIELATNFNALSHVYLIKNSFKTEQFNIEQRYSNE